MTNGGQRLNGRKGGYPLTSSDAGQSELQILRLYQLVA
jgi:hypothetical protein